MHWLPKTKIGKVSFGVGVSAFVLMYLQYWAAMLFQTSIILSGVLVMVFIIGAGIASAVAIVRYRDRAILLFVSAAIGGLGLLLVVGAILIPH